MVEDFSLEVSRRLPIHLEHIRQNQIPILLVNLHLLFLILLEFLLPQLLLADHLLQIYRTKPKYPKHPKKRCQHIKRYLKAALPKKTNCQRFRKWKMIWLKCFDRSNKCQMFLFIRKYKCIYWKFYFVAFIYNFRLEDENLHI